jgi:hypothetical protein
VYQKENGRFRAIATTVPGQGLQVGTWSTAREAAIAVDRVTLYFGREDLPLNFPKLSRELGASSPEALRLEARAASKKETSSQYIGVCWLKAAKMWSAYAHVALPDGEKAVHLGTFRDEKNAAIAHDRYLRGVHGSSAQLNFPNARYQAKTAAELRDWARRLKQEPRAGRYTGVSLRDWNTEVPWAATLRVDGRSVYLGAFRTAKEAATAHDRAALHYLGPDAFLNFPDSRAELEPASAAELRAQVNQQRKRKTSSRYIGVSYIERDGRWRAVIAPGGEYRVIGHFDDEKEAARARDKEALRLLGDEARLNFHPKTGREVLGLRLRELSTLR